MKLLALALFLFLVPQLENPNLNRDVIYLKAAEVKIGNGETCETISEKEMLKAKSILQTYWNKNIDDSTWKNYNRQYMIYNSNRMGRVVFISGACLEKPVDYFETIWCLGMATEPCYYSVYIDPKKKKVISFEWNMYKKK